jgi:hypothetical protein
LFFLIQEFYSYKSVISIKAMGLFFPRLFFLDEKNTIPQISMEKEKKRCWEKRLCWKVLRKVSGVEVSGVYG